MAYYYLEITSGGYDVGKRFLLTEGVSSLGRNTDNTICFNQNERIVSNHHAIIYKFGETITIQDMSSTNGTFKDEIRITQEELAIGNVIGFGEKGPRVKLISSEDELPLNEP